MKEDDVGSDGVLTECWLLQIEKRLAMMRQKLATFGQTANERQTSNVSMMAQLCRLETRYWLGLLPHCRRFVEQVCTISFILVLTNTSPYIVVCVEYWGFCLASQY